MGAFPVPEGVHVPQAIRSLRPRTVEIHTYGYLIIEMHGGIDHYGVLVFPKDFEEPRPGYLDALRTRGDRELVGGLWYYSH